MCTRHDVEEDLAGLLSEWFGVPPDSVRPDSDLLTDLGLDSVELLNAVAIVEERYDLLLTDDELVDGRVFGRFVERIYGRLRV